MFPEWSIACKRAIQTEMKTVNVSFILLAARLQYKNIYFTTPGHHHHCYDDDHHPHHHH